MRCAPHLCFVILIGTGPGVDVGTTPRPVRTFSIREHFGVSHPRQIIDFDLEETVDGQHFYMSGPDGAEVPYQVLADHKIAVEAALPAYAARTWTLYSGRPPKAF